jgi:hypothetical protein
MKLEFLALLLLSALPLTAQAASQCDSSVGYSIEECQACEDLGLNWRSVCAGDGNFGVYYWGCAVKDNTEACPKGWKFEQEETSDKNRGLPTWGKVCGKTELHYQVEPSGC